MSSGAEHISQVCEQGLIKVYTHYVNGERLGHPWQDSPHLEGKWVTIPADCGPIGMLGLGLTDHLDLF